MRDPGPAGRDDRSAFDRLYAETRLDLLRLARLIVDDLQTAEDVTQDAYVGLYRNWNKLRDEGSAVAYLRSAVINNARSVLRRQAAGRLILHNAFPKLGVTSRAALRDALGTRPAR